MRNGVLIFFLTLSLSLNAQWQSIPKAIQTYQWSPSNQFIINPFLNQLWFVRDESAVVLENDGTFNKFTTQLGTLWSGDDLAFAFTPSHIYFARDLYGLSLFDGYIEQGVYGFSNYSGKLRSEGESVFILQTDASSHYVEYTPSFIDEPYFRVASNMAVKNGFMYVDLGSNSSIGYYTTPGTSDFIYIHTDPDYVGGIYNEMKFSRLTDTLFVAGKNGISYAYNYDFLDTITPNNTIGMPSANVLEIEFDHNDSIWAVFGDEADNPIALATLEGTTWTNFYDSNNSPIDFSTFYGMEIDTLGNVWVVDNNALHTLLTPNSPTWLDVNSIDSEQAISIYPNPTAQQVTLSSSEIIDCIEVLDVYGRTILTISEIKATEYNLDFSAYSNGKYILKVISDVKTEFHSINKN
jgi:hypothetical protein